MVVIAPATTSSTPSPSMSQICASVQLTFGAGKNVLVVEGAASPAISDAVWSSTPPGKTKSGALSAVICPTASTSEGPDGRLYKTDPLSPGSGGHAEPTGWSLNDPSPVP